MVYACETTWPFGQCGLGGRCVNGSVCLCYEHYAKTREFDAFVARGGGVTRESLGCNLFIPLDQALHGILLILTLCTFSSLIRYIVAKKAFQDRIEKILPNPNPGTPSSTQNPNNPSKRHSSLMRKERPVSKVWVANAISCVLLLVLCYRRLRDPQQVVVGYDLYHVFVWGLFAVVAVLGIFLKLYSAFMFVEKAAKFTFDHVNASDNSKHFRRLCSRFLLFAALICPVTNALILFDVIEIVPVASKAQYEFIVGYLFSAAAFVGICATTYIRGRAGLIMRSLAESTGKTTENDAMSNMAKHGTLGQERERIKLAIRRELVHNRVISVFFLVEGSVMLAGAFNQSLTLALYYIPVRAIIGMLAILIDVRFAIKRTLLKKATLEKKRSTGVRFAITNKGSTPC